MTQIDIADLDVIFLTFDEPKREEFWIKIKNFYKKLQFVGFCDTKGKAPHLRGFVF